MYVNSGVLLCAGVDRGSISIKGKGVLYIYSICRIKHLSSVLCRYTSLFMRVYMRSVMVALYLQSTLWGYTCSCKHVCGYVVICVIGVHVNVCVGMSYICISVFIPSCFSH